MPTQLSTLLNIANKGLEPGWCWFISYTGGFGAFKQVLIDCKVGQMLAVVVLACNFHVQFLVFFDVRP